MASRILLLTLLLVCSRAWPAEITIDAGRYTGFYGIEDSVYHGNVTLDLKPGVYKIWIGTTEGITLIGTENSIFQLDDDANGRAKIDNNQIHFISYPVTIETSWRWNEWKIQRVTPPMDSRATIYLVPGSGYVLWYYKPQKLKRVMLDMGIDGKAYHWSSAIIDAKEKWQSIPDSLIDFDPNETPTQNPKSLVAEVGDYVAIIRNINPVGFYLAAAFAIFLVFILITSIVIRHLKISIGKYIAATLLLIMAAPLVIGIIDPTDHNLWPLEIALWGAITLSALTFIAFMYFIVLPIARFINRSGASHKSSNSEIPSNNEPDS
jgi:hypothetical protein